MGIFLFSSVPPHLFSAYVLGDVILVTEKFPTGWWRGDLKGREGIFPSELVSKNNVPSEASNVTSVTIAVPSPRRDSDPAPQSTQPSRAPAGSVGKSGWVATSRPTGLTRTLTTDRTAEITAPSPPRIPGPSSPPAVTGSAVPSIPTSRPIHGTRCSVDRKVNFTLGFAKALFDNDADDQTELEFRIGDLIGIEVKDDSGWWFGSLNGRSGFFPANRVETI